MHPRALRRGALSALAALAAAGALAVPAAHADTVLPDNYPSPQATLANAAFLAQVPAPPTGAGTVCVIDTGVTPLPDLTTQIVDRISVVGGSPDDIYHHPDDPFSGHGTFVAATIASQVDGIGSAGIWPAAKIISVRVFRSANGGATSADYRTAINACVQDPSVKVITLSLGASYADADDLARLENKIINAHDNFNVSVVVSAGNDGAAAVNYPARFPSAFAVGATGAAGAFCSFSNRGDGLDVSALGCDTYATSFDGRTGAFVGTSFAAPAAAGILLALRSYLPELSADSVERLVVATARRTSAGPVIDAAAAFRAVGLNAVVDASSSTATGSSGVAAPVRIAPSADIVTGPPAPPKLRGATFRKHVMRVRVTPAPRGGTVIFRVSGDRVYKRPYGALVLRARSWRGVTVLTEDQYGLRSAPIKIKRPGIRPR